MRQACILHVKGGSEEVRVCQGSSLSYNWALLGCWVVSSQCPCCFLDTHLASIQAHMGNTLSPARMGASLVAQMVKKLPAMQETPLQSLGHKDPLKKGMATHSRFLAWRIPWTEEPGGLQSMGHKEWDMAEWLTLFSQNEFSYKATEDLKSQAICYLYRE